MMIIFTVPEENGRKVLTMTEYIRREDAIKCIEGQCVDGKMWGNDESEGTLIEAYSAINDLMEIPPADVAQVRHGRWERTADGAALCTACKRKMNPYQYGYAFCSLCGAKMDG